MEFLGAAEVSGGSIAGMLYSVTAMTREGDTKRLEAARRLERLRERLAHAEDGWFFAQIADQLVEQRRSRGLSQAELAALCGTTQSAIARLEAGGRPPRIDTLLRIAGALDCDLLVELRPRARVSSSGGAV